MQTQNRLFDDLAKVASGAMNTVSGLREEIELRVKERMERFAADLDLVSREEFEAVKAMAAKARAEQEDTAAKLAALEAKLHELSEASASTTTSKSRSKKASSSKSSSGSASDADDSPADTDDTSGT
ncbi:MAG: accessory factor UbiK family protein [Geminicoccaceae bacterium]